MFDTKPSVSEVALRRDYSFMCENFVVLTQRGAYLLMEKSGDATYGLYFDSANVKYGSPNDEVRGGHPLAKFGLGLYGLFEVANSPWLREMMLANRIHPSHSDSMFDGLRHFIACFKDVTFECACRNLKEVTLSQGQFDQLVADQLRDLET
jgi:hypothetical protein